MKHRMPIFAMLIVLAIPTPALAQSPGYITFTQPPYNADPTGSIDATSAINAALASGNPIFCDGTFKVTGAIAYNIPTGGGVSIQGAGRQLCKFVDSYADGDMFSFTLPASNEYTTPQVVLKDFSVVPATVNAYAALHVSSPGVIGSTDPEMWIQNIDVKPSAPGNYTMLGIHVTDVRNWTIDGANIEGNRNGYVAGTKAIVLDGATSPVDAYIAHTHLYFYETGVTVTGTWQGVGIHHNTLVALRYGVNIAAPTSGDWFDISDNQFTVTDNAITCTTVPHCFMHDNYAILLNAGAGSATSAACYIYEMTTATTADGFITHNSCDGYQRSQVKTRYGVYINGYSSGTLALTAFPNNLSNLDVGTYLGRDARTVTVETGAAGCSGVTLCVLNAAGAGANFQTAPSPY